MGIIVVCDFCKQPISSITGKFRHEVSSANFMMGLLDKKDEMCDICYSRAKLNPPSKEDVGKGNKDRTKGAEKMLEDLLKL